MVNLKTEFPANFFQEEIRCDYKITKETKELWAVEIDLLSELMRVCKKHNIKFYASGGTLLGAIRHQGFIPWDDDIDLRMFREDYNKLCEVADKEFKYPYFFQTNYNDRGTLRGHAQLRNSQTTAMLAAEGKNYNFNQGIFIDIFPMDLIIEDQKKLLRQKKKAEFYKKLAIHCSPDSSFYTDLINKKNYKSLILKVLKPIFKGIDFENYFYHKFELSCQLYNGSNSEKASFLSFSVPEYFKEKYFEDVSDYRELEYVPFEFIEIPVPVKYEKILKKQYGDYKHFVKGANFHGDMFVDTDKSYECYVQDRK